MKRYESDAVTAGHIFGDVDFDLYSASQITDLVATDYIDMADEHAKYYLEG